MTTGNEEPKPTGPVKYTFDKASGQVHRQEPEAEREHIATILAGTVIWTDADKRDRFRAVLSKKMKEWKVSADSEKLAGEPGRPARNPGAGDDLDFPEESGEQEEGNTDTDEGLDPETPAPPPPRAYDHFADMEPDVAVAVRKLRAMQGYPEKVETPAPPPPKRTSGAGDKTEAFVEWMLRYHPDRFARRYGIKGVGSIEVRDWELNPETNRRRRIRRREPGHVLARRKTHLTALADNYVRNEERNATEN